MDGILHTSNPDGAYNTHHWNIYEPKHLGEGKVHMFISINFSVNSYHYINISYPVSLIKLEKYMLMDLVNRAP